MLRFGAILGLACMPVNGREVSVSIRSNSELPTSIADPRTARATAAGRTAPRRTIEGVSMEMLAVWRTTAFRRARRWSGYIALMPTTTATDSALVVNGFSLPAYACSPHPLTFRGQAPFDRRVVAGFSVALRQTRVEGEERCEPKAHGGGR